MSGWVDDRHRHRHRGSTSSRCDCDPFSSLTKLTRLLFCWSAVEYDTMDLEMLREVVPMLRQQLEKSMFDRNYVQLERVRGYCYCCFYCCFQWR